MKDKYSKVYYKDIWGFWIFKRYSLYVEDKTEGVTEVLVDKVTWELYNIGDRYEIPRTTR